MASIHKEIIIDALPERVWDAIRDVGAVHKRLVVDFVTDTRLEEGARIVTFANGMIVRELIVDIDDKARRVAYAVVGGRFKHHNASMQVFAEGTDRARLAWITDLLPNELAGPIGALVDQGAEAMKTTLELASASRLSGLAEEPET
jgi:carbon monoxide dehydrogenase subunit G